MLANKKCACGPSLQNIFVRILFVFLAHTCCFSIAFAQDKCALELVEAKKKYEDNQFNEAITLLTTCLKKGNLVIADSGAIKLLAKAYHAKNLRDSAKESLKFLLELVPNWEPDPVVDQPSFRQLAEEARREVAQERQTQQLPSLKKPEQKPSRGGSKKWPWIVGGAVATGTIVYFLVIKDGDKEERLPDPPALPPRL